MNVSDFVVLLVTVLIGVTAVSTVVGSIYNFTGDVGANADREALSKLGERTQNKCDVVRERQNTDPLVIKEIEFGQIKEIKIGNSGPEGSRYEALFPNQGPASYDIEGCKVEIDSGSIGPGSWKITISKQTSGTDSLIVEAEEP